MGHPTPIARAIPPPYTNRMCASNSPNEPTASTHPPTDNLPHRPPKPSKVPIALSSSFVWISRSPNRTHSCFRMASRAHHRRVRGAQLLMDFGFLGAGTCTPMTYTLAEIWHSELPCVPDHTPIPQTTPAADW